MITENQLEQLKRLKELLEAGILTQEEFDQKKELVLQEAEESAIQIVEPVSEKTGENDVHPDEMAEKEEASVNQGEIVLEDKKSESESSDDKSTSEGEANPDGADQKSAKKEPIYKKKGFIIGAAVVALLIIGAIAAASNGNDSKTASDTNKSDSIEESTDAEVEEEPEVTSIEAQYSGSTEAGTVLDSDNSGITVTATYDDGSTGTLVFWDIQEPQTLQAGQTSVVTINASGQTCELSVACTSLTEKDFKKQCKKISYEKLAREPDAHNGEYIKIHGQVIQVLEEDNSVTLRVATKDSGYGNYYDDVVLVYYEYGDQDKKILEDDMITLWGKYGGTYTYETTMGGNVTVPMMYASYFSL